MQCPKCGNPIEASDLFCGECGTKLSHQTNTTNETKNKSNYASEHNSTESNATQISTQDSTQSNHKNEQFSKHTSDIFNEAKTFFSTAFRHPDKELVSPHFFSYKTLFSLIVAGLLLSIILLTILIPAEVAYFMTSKASVVFNISLFLLIAITVLFGITFALIKILNINSTLHKVFSDFVLVNTLSVITLLFGLLFLAIHVPSFAVFLIIIAILFTLIAPIYLITKYSHNQLIRMPVIYSIFIYIIILGIILRIIVESTVSNTLSDLSSFFNTGY
ncbi:MULTISPECIES: zinc ribbon domain-containing protein [Staphylococcus]|uniref:Putative zinc-ribbon domain-containing protein n=1 Tax=Staphylococcus ureilyticus TaxID=94138 RepID=A0AB34AJ38_STAUR|nr:MULTISPECIES: zinc ribbon domain-containing protein [Staphylococcus]AVL77264.1 zinc ribbon domain-containing protein [Staphylococcus cohnii]MBL0376135.1 zinc ribbon domain-containing protein [Staphylococcus sp. S75]MBL0383140.1 zinc ribbon domain-containing protein [Staphylococcus sp. S59]MBL0401030.1 zinc ribbon domain-containing protein [Staphylococcus sp. S36]MCT1914694.1 zinc ribbon domain-containing protein [Staphylococcus ureilyticus]